MHKKNFNIKSRVWLYPTQSVRATSSQTGWHFVTVDKKTSKEIKESQKGPRRGFGSIRVEVTIGKTIWKTSIFPVKDGTYVLPLKATVRREEGIFDDDTITLQLKIL